MLDQRLIQKTHRIPAHTGPAGDGTAITRQLDAALLSVGFKASKELLEHLNTLHPDTVLDTAVTVIGAVRHLVGDHARHNVYFKNFPDSVPDTVEFWMSLLSKQLAEVGGSATIPGLMLGGINLLDLPGYGTYQHSYEEMLAAHDQFIPAMSDRVTVLHLGGSLDEEAARVYLDLAGSRTPLNEDDLGLLELLAAWCADGTQPESVPVRENKALINRVRFAHDKPLLADTVTDVLRLAAALSGGDVTLEQPTRFVSLGRPDRRALLAALESVVSASPAKLSDVPARREAFKRLGERLHPHEYSRRYPNAAVVFAVARGEQEARSLASRIDARFAAGQTIGAVLLMAKAPGILIRNVDRAARGLTNREAVTLRGAVVEAAAHASGRVLLSLREHLANRTESSQGAKRIFVARSGRAWVTDDTRPVLPAEFVADLTESLDREIGNRMPEVGRLVVDPAVYRAVIPLSGKATSVGYGVMPRGSRTPVGGGHLRFFTHWMQAERRTDFDLSVLLLDEKFQNAGHVSWTRLAGAGAVHSGDVTDAPAPHGGSEFIDLDLARVQAAYVVPQVNIYSGESFTECAESFFGYMALDAAQRGKPFEPRTVRMKAEMRGAGRIALPLAFARGESGWEAVWMNLFAKGAGWGNRVEGNRLSTTLLARTIIGREYLTLAYLVDALAGRATGFSEWKDGAVYGEPVTFIGVDRPEGLPDGSDVYTLERWSALVPA